MNHYDILEQEISEFMADGDPSDAQFEELALRIHSFQRRHNKPYDNYCARLGITPETWRQIPPAPQSAFKYYALRAFPSQVTCKIFRTSGTTGEGFGEHHFCSLRLYDESILRGWDVSELPVLPQLLLAQTPEQAPHSSLSYMFGKLGERANSQEWFANATGGTDFECLCRRLAGSVTPVLLLGTALAFVHLFEELERRNEKFCLPAGSAALETGGYKGLTRAPAKNELYEQFLQRLGISPRHIVNEYGMTELSSQFYARGLAGIHRGQHWLRALIVDAVNGCEVANGEIGIVRIFDLANLGSVIAIETQDLARRRENGFELIGRDPRALSRGCSRAADELLSSR